jgi:hypothetical protein
MTHLPELLLMAGLFALGGYWARLAYVNEKTGEVEFFKRKPLKTIFKNFWKAMLAGIAFLIYCALIAIIFY